MSADRMFLGRFQVVRRLRAGDADLSPILVTDPSDGSEKVVRPISVAAARGARLFLGVDHPQCVGIRSIEGEGGARGLFAVSDFVTGVDLEQGIGELSFRHALRVVLDVVDGLAYLHSVGLTHGDVKPSNVIITLKGRGVLIDPFLPGDVAAARGTMEYLAPERLLLEDATPAADLYAIGVVLYQLLTGAVPFQGNTPLDVVRAILRGAPEPVSDREDPATAHVADLALSLLAREPTLRPVDARGVAKRLRQLLDLPPERDDEVAPIRSLAVAPAVFPPADLAQLDQFLDRVARNESRVLAVLGGNGRGATSFLDRVRDMALTRTWVCLRLEALDIQSDDAEPDVARRGIVASSGSSDELIRQLSQRATEQGLVILVDDLHLASRERRQLLHRILEEVRGTLGVVATGDEAGTILALPRGVVGGRDTLRLSPLGEPEILELIRGALPTLLGPLPLAVGVARQTGGLPSAVRALLLRLAAANAFVPCEGGIQLDPDVLRTATLPQSMAAAGRSLLASVSPPQRRLLRVLAAVEIPIGVDELALATEQRVGVVAAGLAALTERRIVRRAGGSLPFVSFLFPTDRVAVCGEEPGRAEDLARLARVLGERAARQPDVAVAVAALVETESPALAFRMLVRGARRFLDARRAEPSLAAVEQALRHDPSGTTAARLAPLRARALAMLGRHAEAEPLLAEAAATARGDAAKRLILERAQMLERIGRPEGGVQVLRDALERVDFTSSRDLRATLVWCQFVAGNVAESRSDLDRLIAEPPTDDAGLELEVAAVAAAVFDRQGERRRARAAAIRARRLARSLGRMARAAHFDSTLGHFDVDGGFEARGLRRLARGLRLLEQDDDRRLLPDALCRHGFRQLRYSDPRAALESFQRASLLFQGATSRRGTGWAANGQGLALLALGDPEGAAQAFERSVEDRRAVRSEPGAALSAVNLYLARLALGDALSARKGALQAWKLSAGDANVSARVELLLALADESVSRGSVRRVLGFAARAKRLVEQSQLASSRGGVEVRLAEGALLAGKFVEGLSRSLEARRLAREISRAEFAVAGATAAAAIALQGRPLAAQRRFERAMRSVADPRAAIRGRLVFARAALMAAEQGDGSLTRSGESAAAEAERGGAALRDRTLIDSARRLVASLGAVAGRASVPVEAARKTKALRHVLEVSRWINEATEVEEVLRRIVDAALQVSGASRGFVIVADGAGVLSFVGARSRQQQDIDDPEEQVSRSIVEEAIRTGRTVITSEARTDSRFRAFQSIADLELLSVLCAPLMSRGRTVGALYIDDQARVDRFDSDASEPVERLADHAALALDNARMRAEIEQLNRRLSVDVRQRSVELDAAKVDLEKARIELAERYASRNIITGDPRMLSILSMVDRIADSDAPVLIEGGPGTGKELVARSLHFSSHRRTERFVAVNCASIPETLVESEMFGYRKGAFSGALRDRDGWIAAADRGTLFLDEIGEMPISMQAKFLRVLQDGEYFPLGSDTPRSARFRVVSASNRSLPDLIDRGLFREDLFYRLKVVLLSIPPLRDRKGDVDRLIRYFVTKHTGGNGAAPRRLTSAAHDALVRWRWPGNVRELEATIRMLVLTVPDDPIDIVDLPAEILGDPEPATNPSSSMPTVGNELDSLAGVELDVPLADARERFERAMVKRALEQCGRQRGKTAELLQVSRRWLQKLIDKYDL